MYFVKETTTESVSGPPDISVPAARAVSEMFSPFFFASEAKRTSAETSSASLGETTSAGLRSKMLVSRLNFLSVSASSCTSPLMTEAICERKSIGELYHLESAEGLNLKTSRTNQCKVSLTTLRTYKIWGNGRRLFFRKAAVSCPRFARLQFFNISAAAENIIIFT